MRDLDENNLPMAIRRFDPCNRLQDHDCHVPGEQRTSVCKADSEMNGVRYAFTCQCASGFRAATTIDHRDFCVDINECEEFYSVCNPPDSCRNTYGSCHCKCPFGFALTSNNTCTPRDACAENPTYCSQGLHGKCEAKTYPEFSCSCDDGYTLNSEMHVCEDINQCLDIAKLKACSRPAYNCINKPGKYICSCSKGFYRENDDETKDCVISAFGMQIRLTFANPFEQELNDRFSPDYENFIKDAKQLMTDMMVIRSDESLLIGTEHQILQAYAGSDALNITQFGDSFINITMYLYFKIWDPSWRHFNETTTTVRTLTPKTPDSTVSTEGSSISIEVNPDSSNAVDSSSRIAEPTRQKRGAVTVPPEDMPLESTNGNNALMKMIKDKLVRQCEDIKDDSGSCLLIGTKLRLPVVTIWDAFSRNRTLPKKYEIKASEIGIGCKVSDINDCTNLHECRENRTNNFPFACICKDPYIRTGHENHRDTCLDPCAENPCFNGGTCRVDDTQPGDFICACSTGYFGRTCNDEMCEKSYCSNHGECIVKDLRSLQCICDTFYSGSNCETNITMMASMCAAIFFSCLLALVSCWWLWFRLTSRKKRDWWEYLHPTKVVS